MKDKHNFKKYTNYWEKNKIMARAVMRHNPKTVLDVGCGEGKLIKLLRDEGIDAWGLDIEPMECIYAKDYCVSGNAKEMPFKNKEFDVVVSNDFFEHITEEDIDKVYQEMKRVGKQIIARISLKKKDNHLTVKSIFWWQEKLPDCQFIGKDWK